MFGIQPGARWYRLRHADDLILILQTHWSRRADEGHRHAELDDRLDHLGRGYILQILYGGVRRLAGLEDGVSIRPMLDEVIALATVDDGKSEHVALEAGRHLRRHLRGQPRSAENHRDLGVHPLHLRRGPNRALETVLEEVGVLKLLQQARRCKKLSRTPFLAGLVQ